MVKPRKPLSIQADAVFISVADNGYSLEVPGETENHASTYFVFTKIEELTAWLALHLATPFNAPSH